MKYVRCYRWLYAVFTISLQPSNSASTVCPSTPDMYHLRTHLLPITRFEKEELDEAVRGMKHALKMSPPMYAPA